MTKSTKGTHLTFDDRIEIQDCLNHGMTFKAIGKRLNKDQTTISKEVKRSLTVKPTTIIKKNKDGNIISNICPILLKAPFVCNGCKKKNSICPFDKSMYYAKTAQKRYEDVLSDSRKGIALNKESFYEMDKIISNGLKNGQHIYHIVKTNNLCISERTIYRHLHNGYYSADLFDAPRILKFKARKKDKPEYVPKGIKIGRTYEDYLKYIEEHKDIPVIEMDTFIGKAGGKVLLTMIFNNCNFMFAKLLPDKTSMSVSKAIIELKMKLEENGYNFGKIFPVILTDNGGEFSDVFTIENSLAHETETKVFYCDPLHSSQKPHVEKNHTLLRDIVPKGSSFEDFSQETIDLIFSHINSVKRKQLQGKTPFELFSFMYDERLANCLGIHKIEAENVIQSKKLLATKH